MRQNVALCRYWLRLDLALVRLGQRLIVTDCAKEPRASIHQTFTTQCHILTHERHIALENVVRKGEIACNKQFLLFSPCFLPYMALIFPLKLFLDFAPEKKVLWEYPVTNDA